MFGEVEVGVCGLGAAFVLGCWWGLWLAWTQKARMDRFAVAVWLAQHADQTQRKFNEWEGYGDDVVDRAAADLGSGRNGMSLRSVPGLPEGA